MIVKTIAIRMHAFTTMRMYSIMFLYAPSFCQETIIMCCYNRMTSYSIAIRFDYNLLRFSLINSEQLEVIELNFHSLTYLLTQNYSIDTIHGC